MGLTHYWKRPTELPAEAFAKASADCQRFMETVGIRIADSNSKGKPTFSADAIIFNGVDGRCEAFEIHQTAFDRHGRPEFFEFCKTNKAPYDICVKVALIILQHYLSDTLTVSSDGKDPDWEDARAICQDVLGFGTDFKLTRE